MPNPSFVIGHAVHPAVFVQWRFRGPDPVLRKRNGRTSCRAKSSILFDPECAAPGRWWSSNTNCRSWSTRIGSADRNCRNCARIALNTAKLANQVPITTPIIGGNRSLNHLSVPPVGCGFYSVWERTLASAPDLCRKTYEAALGPADVEVVQRVCFPPTRWSPMLIRPAIRHARP